VSLTICKHIAKAPQAQAQSKALSKSLQSQPKRKGNFKKCPTARQKTLKNATTNRPTNHGRQGSTGGNMRLASCGVTSLHSSAVFQFNFSAGLTVLCPEIPHERQAQKRYAQPDLVTL